MLQRLLIANRGEIACRIIQTAKRLGIHTIAVYSDADQSARHVRLADEAYWIGPAPALESYLNIDALVQAALASRAEAIHPGYGFLSENPRLAQACIDHNLVFVGPSVQALTLMGSKQESKAMLSGSQVPLTPGYHGNDQSLTRLTQEVQRLGFPVLIKAAAGGGGKGMRVVDKLDSLEADISAAQREALAYFGDATLILEKYLARARHVEVQIMGDQHGHVYSLFDRDCSIQRRHQKIIEEAPAPHLHETTRKALHQAARDVAQRIHYEGAGTIEFLLDEEQNFYFMEMNTRLQVEHPVTEAITGLDLVEWQLRIAQGEPLPASMASIVPQGHAIECRIYAEDPEHDFLPSVGELVLLHEPSGPGIRVDRGYDSHDRLSSYYDPLISKLITHGRNRQEACQMMQTALQRYAVTGIATNLGFLQSVIQHHDFQTPRLSTQFLAEATLEDLPSQVFKSAQLLLIAWHYGQLKPRDALIQATFGFHPWTALGYTLTFKHQQHILQARIEVQTPTAFKLLDEAGSDSPETWVTYRIQTKDQQVWIQTPKETLHGWVYESREQTYCVIQGLSFKFEQLSESTEHRHSSQNHSAPMPGKVVAVLKNKGEHVERDEPVLILEAMKMEHSIRAAEAGIVEAVFYQTGDVVQEGHLLFELQAENPES
jgi:3-methylcrotonyl-CoA carboxylase alpha subunit